MARKGVRWNPFITITVIALSLCVQFYASQTVPNVEWGMKNTTHCWCAFVFAAFLLAIFFSCYFVSIFYDGEKVLFLFVVAAVNICVKLI